MRKLGGVFLSLFLSFIGLVAVTTPAQAATEPMQEICNSINSVGGIRLYTISGGAWSYDLGRGTCVVAPNGVNRLRVDVDYDWSGCTDVDSYRIGVEGQGYGPCHSGENSASDPPNTAPLYDKYNTDASGC